MFVWKPELCFPAVYNLTPEPHSTTKVWHTWTHTVQQERWSASPLHVSSPSNIYLIRLHVVSGLPLTVPLLYLQTHVSNRFHWFWLCCLFFICNKAFTDNFDNENTAYELLHGYDHVTGCFENNNKINKESNIKPNTCMLIDIDYGIIMYLVSYYFLLISTLIKILSNTFSYWLLDTRWSNHSVVQGSSYFPVLCSTCLCSQYTWGVQTFLHCNYLSGFFWPKDII